eukprot:scaffold1740_cov254-Pinguiococcus_pyrenoidosus.AAC.18
MAAGGKRLVWPLGRSDFRPSRFRSALLGPLRAVARRLQQVARAMIQPQPAFQARSLQVHSLRTPDRSGARVWPRRPFRRSPKERYSPPMRFAHTLGDKCICPLRSPQTLDPSAISPAGRTENIRLSAQSTAAYGTPFRSRVSPDDVERNTLAFSSSASHAGVGFCTWASAHSACVEGPDHPGPAPGAGRLESCSFGRCRGGSPAAKEFLALRERWPSCRAEHELTSRYLRPLLRRRAAGLLCGLPEASWWRGLFFFLWGGKGGRISRGSSRCFGRGSTSWSRWLSFGGSIAGLTRLGHRVAAPRGPAKLRLMSRDALRARRFLRSRRRAPCDCPEVATWPAPRWRPGLPLEIVSGLAAARGEPWEGGTVQQS